MCILMKQNIGPLDQWVRLAAGFVLVLLAGTGIVGSWGWLGVLPMLSAMLRYCPVYHALGIHTGRR